MRNSKPHADSYSDLYTNAYCYTYSHGDTYSYGNSDCDYHGYAERDPNAVGNPASAHAKAAAYSVPTADAVRRNLQN